MRETSLKYTDIVFNAKPDAVPYNYRISYKVSQLCLIMHICGRRDICSLIKLHMISFALISQENMKKLVEFTDGIGNAPIVRFDPSINLMVTEIGDLNLLAKKLTESKVEEIVDTWRIKDAENH